MLQIGLKRNNGNSEEECQKASKAEWLSTGRIKNYTMSTLIYQAESEESCTIIKDKIY